MTSTVKETIRDIKLYELGIRDKLPGYDDLMSLSGVKAFKVEGDETFYGKANDIKFIHYNHNREYIHINAEVWLSLGDSFKLSYSETRELIMWSIGSDPNLKGIPTTCTLYKNIGTYWG